MGNNESIEGGNTYQSGEVKKRRHGRRRKKGPVIDPAVLEAYPDRKWDAAYISRLITSQKLAPLTLGSDDPSTEHDEECPICFLYYSYGLNQTVCCKHAICTKCFLALQPQPSRPSEADVKCPFCNFPRIQVDFTGPQSEEVVKAKKIRDKQAESQRLNADKFNGSQPQGTPTSSAVQMTEEQRRKRQEELKAVQKRQEERFEEERSHMTEGSALIYTITTNDYPQEQEDESVAQRKTEVNVEQALGDGFYLGVETVLLLQFLRRLAIAPSDADDSTVLAQGAELARKLEAVCDLVDMTRAEDVRNACSLFTDPSMKDVTPPETLLCAQLFQEIARE